MTIFSILTPKDDTPGSVVVWRERLAAWGTGLTLAVFLIFVILFNFDLDRPGWRFISAANADEKHESLEADLSAIMADIATVQGDLAGLAANDRERAEREKAREIREVRAAILDLQLKACQAQGALRSSLIQQVGDLRSDYMGLTNEEFPPTPCTDLLGNANG